uniref:Uncharacterized protein n=1 Tax=Anguilla anguilla TaxID=7936 RepID=A0A0E9T3R0_ANGAN
MAVRLRLAIRRASELHPLSPERSSLTAP